MARRTLKEAAEVLNRRIGSLQASAEYCDRHSQEAARHNNAKSQSYYDGRANGFRSAIVEINEAMRECGLDRIKTS